jgi:hypothetical protein
MKILITHNLFKQMFLPMILVFGMTLFVTTSCAKDDVVVDNSQENPDDGSDNIDPTNNGVYVLPNLSVPVHYPGIAIYTADMGKNRSTEVNSEWVIRNSQYTNVSSEIIRNGYNALHKIDFSGFNTTTDYFEFVVAIHGKLINRVPVPDEFLENLTGISFRAVSYGVPINITLEAFSNNGTLIKSENFAITTDAMKTFTMAITDQNLHHISFKTLGSNQDISTFKQGALGIDDIYLNNDSTAAFQPPLNDAEFIEWLKKSSINYFLWNYRDVGNGRGVVLEASDETSRVSLSGLGYAYANYILAAHENMITSQLAKERILSILKWQQAQNWFNGSGGVYGFPLHYYNADGSGLYQNDAAAVSTIDWAICAAGLRTVRQKFLADAEIVSICNELLNRPLWQETIHSNTSDSYRFGRISKGLNANNGAKNGQVWADAFSEETEIIYLEALASSKVNNLNLGRIFREQKGGYYVSWFGAGFTYNWLQLWTGSKEPYKSNSIAAYQSDATTCNSQFGKPIMGLTACGTISNVTNSGFINWDKYISNQGAFVSGANNAEVIQISPAPYGAVLALPFLPTNAIQALREYVKIGYYHPLLGLPDNIRINDLPQNLDVPVPNWNSFDINIGPIAMAIDQYQQNIISNLYRNDSDIVESLQSLIQSF